MNLTDRVERIHLKFLEPDYEDTSEDRIREIIRYLICEKDGYLSTVYSRNKMTFEIIKLIKCDVKNANQILRKMDDLGLGYCTPLGVPYDIDGSYLYDILKFGEMRGYVRDDEIEDFLQRKRDYEKYIQENA